MKKRILLILTAGCLLAFLAACGNSASPVSRSKGESQPVSSQAVVSATEKEESEPGSEPMPESVSEAISVSAPEAANGGAANAEEEYQSILDKYSAKIREAAPALVEEYKAEAQKNAEGIQGLAKLSNDKISELAKISNEGVQEMAKVYYKMGSGEYSEYEEWAGKLMDVYMEEAQKITDAYMNSAM